MSSVNWENFFADPQRGSGFVGYKYQRGGLALGSLFGGLLRTVLPVIRGVGRSVAKQAARTGMEVASDLIEGENIKDSLENRGRSGAASLLRRTGRAMGLGGERKRRVGEYRRLGGAKKKKKVGQYTRLRGGGGLGTFKSGAKVKKVRGRRKEDIFA